MSVHVGSMRYGTLSQNNNVFDLLLRHPYGVYGRYSDDGLDALALQSPPRRDVSPGVAPDGLA